ncbi:MAG: TIGR03936 family radical SAM-associated protein [Caldicoprobacterales bacterium]|jgi:radical SAM-linked protein
MRILLEYTRGERVKYISHLDLMRAMQRAVRRAELPIAFSQGFNPHPIMAFASALPVGTTSEREYMDILLTKPVSLSELKEKMNLVLPKGITVTEAMVIDNKTPSLMSLIQKADYEIRAEEVDWEKALKAYQEVPEIWIEKKTKKRTSRVNIKEDAVESFRLDSEDDLKVHLSMRIGSRGSIKPEVVIQEVLKISGQIKEGEDLSDFQISIHRTGQFLLRDGQWVTPLVLKKD